MNPLIQDKLLDLLVNIVAIILGGGLITLVIEWRRHKREQLSWKREDGMIEIDIPRSELRFANWQITDKTSDKDKLLIYENRLENTVKHTTIIAEFVIRNTTPSEIIITSYNADVLGIPSGNDVKKYYDLETLDLISKDDIGAIRLKPYATIPRFIVIDSEFGKDRMLDSVPATLLINVNTSNGKIIQGKTSLKVIQGFTDIEWYRGEYHPKKYVDKIRNPDDVPF